MAETRARSRGWLASAVVIACVTVERVIAASSLDRAVRVTALLGMAGVAVAVSFHQALGFKRESRLLRAMVLVPMAFSVVVVAVLVLDAHFRRALGGR
jgi:hypothetical protein